LAGRLGILTEMGNGIGERVTGFIWDRDLKQTGWAEAFGFHVMRVFYVMLRDLRDGQLTLRAMGLVYTTLLSAVPLLAIGLSVLKGFGVHNEFAPILRDFLAPMGEQGNEIAGQILGFVENTRVGILSSVGVVLLLYTVLSVMQKIEDALNHIWHVREKRSFSRRFSDYLSVLLIGPVLIVASTGLSGAAMNNEIVGYLTQIEPLGMLIRFGVILVPLAMAIAAFTMIYIFIPNTKVQVPAALLGGCVAAILWKLAGWFFAVFVVSSGKYEAVYSAFASLIVFMLWLYTSWLIVMIGASIAFYHQHPEFLAMQRERARLSARVKEKLALLIMHRLAVNCYADGRASKLAELTQATGVASDLASAVVESLNNAGFIVRTADRADTYLPGRPLDATTVLDIVAAMRRDGEDKRSSYGSLTRVPAIELVDNKLSVAAEAALAKLTIKDLAVDNAANPTIS
jgi:membrane protein